MNNFSVLDLFSGMGGFSYGFNKMGFSVTGVDWNPKVGLAYESLNGSNFVQKDLLNESIYGDFDIVIGGPPCRPWSAVNQSTRRGSAHRDFGLLGRFFDHVLTIKPTIFILENVPLLVHDPEFAKQLAKAKFSGYSVSYNIFKYSDFGAATSRRRLIVVGIRNGDSENFFQDIAKFKTTPSDVKSTILKYRNVEKNAIKDHVWPELHTVLKYREKYESGRFGWRILKWEEAAPSFGNVMKTYILHPDSNLDIGIYRTVSVLEVSRIMGFNHGFVFPDGLGMSQRYQMLVDSVSPVFSIVLAHVVKKWL